VDRVMRPVDTGAAQVADAATDRILSHSLEPPRTLTTAGTLEPIYWDTTIDEVMSIAVQNAEVLRDLGATLLRAPETVSTRYQLPIRQFDPQHGIEAALSAFDAQLDSSVTFQDNNRVFNNRFFGGGTNSFVQDRHDYVAQLSKLTATGGQLALRSLTDYDSNNAPGNLFRSAWQQQFEGEVRQPLFQGGGVTYNRIAGPAGRPGVANGVLIAKVTSDINEAEFERSWRNYISEVANAYWDLYFAYRDLDSKQQGLVRSRETWRNYEAQTKSERGSSANEALAREQFFRFQAELNDAIAGKVNQRTQVYNGATGGAFRGLNGVQFAERRLRLLIGLPPTDDRMLRPLDEPEVAPIKFDWTSVAEESLRRRQELRMQRLLVKQRELELIAARNYLAPRLDAIARYRVRGLGHNLAGNESDAGLRSAYNEVGTFEHQEWELGLEFSVPIGFRRAHAAVKQAEFLVARERAVLVEQERQIIHDLASTVAEVDRAYIQVQSNLNRYIAAQDALSALEANREAGLTVSVEQLLDIERRLTEAQTQYYVSRVEYAIALKNVHFEKGSLLEYNNLAILDQTSTIPAEVRVMQPTESLMPQPDVSAPPLLPSDQGTPLPNSAPAPGNDQIDALFPDDLQAFDDVKSQPAPTSVEEIRVTAQADALESRQRTSTGWKQVP
ncbi:MAG: TolC family protein, partial [Planctomycetaceae bacterium]|nr:TolC family protein [Planctomycetaceae bacterium]